MYFYGTNNTVKVYPVPIEITDALNAVGNSMQCSGTGGAFAELITVTSCPVPIGLRARSYAAGKLMMCPGTGQDVTELLIRRNCS